MEDNKLPKISRTNEHEHSTNCDEYKPISSIPIKKKTMFWSVSAVMNINKVGISQIIQQIKSANP